ncbi:hypothetical protein [Leptospira kirschneri]|uniref:Uncharacterized protein n=1 Tax=Leptospira kirschneri str. H1 TaxID=1049966 RepID=A0A0E2B095_9LEPT|nr:hypothetical protein [Leptospira kirschneri]EKO14650.1 hypothetical protein LEP1GSC081_1590 [Leptospira kirschneri str. H1]
MWEFLHFKNRFAKFKSQLFQKNESLESIHHVNQMLSMVSTNCYIVNVRTLMRRNLFYARETYESVGATHFYFELLEVLSL